MMLALAFLLISRICLRLAKGLPFYRELDDHSAHALAHPFLFVVLDERRS